MSTTETKSVLEIFESLNLEDVEAEMAQANADLEAIIAEKSKKIDALLEIQRVLLIRRDGRAPKKTWSRKKKTDPETAEPKSDNTIRTLQSPSEEPPEKVTFKPGEMSDLKGKLHTHLRLHGRKNPQELSKTLKIDYQRVYPALQDKTVFLKCADNRYEAR